MGLVLIPLITAAILVRQFHRFGVDSFILELRVELIDGRLIKLCITAEDPVNLSVEDQEVLTGMDE